jgi:hypothetical protein
MRHLPLIALIACTGPTPTATPTGISPTDVPFTPPPGTDQGDIALVRGYTRGQLVRSELVALFASDLQEVLNPAQCVVDESRPCLRRLPEAIGDQVTYDRLDRYVENQSLYRYVGLTVPFGPYETFYQVEDDLSWYYADVTDQGDVQGPVDAAVDVEWGVFPLPDLIDVPPGLDVLSPPSDQTLRAFSNDEDFTFTWTAREADEMYLFIETDDETEPGRVLRIADNGSYTLDLASLGLVENTLLTMQLARWQRAAVDVNGNALSVLVTAESDFTVEYVPVGNRGEIDVQTDCFAPVALPPGGYFGDLADMTNTFEISDCVQNQEPTAGLDAVYAIEIPPYTRAELDFRQLEANGAFYLLESCDPINPVCVEGADRGFGLQTETITRFNDQPEPEQFILVVDGILQTTGGLFFLDYDATEVLDPELADECADAPLLAPGTYFARQPGVLLDRLDPGFLGCTDSSLPGGDGTVSVDVPPGGTLEVTVSMPGDDPALYIHRDCADLAQCIVGSDDAGSIETVSWTNSGSEVDRVLLTVDTSGALLLPFTLTVTIL